ncbi:hypothetical protein [Chitinophaga pinensis]|uniref:Uncharacterized protein n=1 Tax=Chitinophaga pinensis TaxID=79329 RepID=A0A5C6LNI3_9BACT|nr:hypothetical protein [Chitinophaga pinensis]TWV96213.1 hypothetical protein FEF09_23815 [Chitinophaga pinensis]
MRYKILDALPVYGPMPVAIPDTFYSVGFPVQFFKSDGTDWVANFAPGETDFNGIYPLLQSEHVLVISGGTGYVMHPDRETVIELCGCDVENLFILEDGRMVLQERMSLTVIEVDGTCWDTERISWSGMKDLHVHGNVVSGLAVAYDGNYDEHWVEFRYDVDKRELAGGGYDWE